MNNLEKSQEELKEIENSINIIDTINPEQTFSENMELRVPALVIKISNNLELKFLQKLCRETSKDSKMKIKLLVQIDSTLKPIGYLEFRFNVIQKIHLYNNKLKIGIYNPEVKKIKHLKPIKELFLL